MRRSSNGGPAINIQRLAHQVYIAERKRGRIEPRGFSPARRSASLGDGRRKTVATPARGGGGDGQKWEKEEREEAIAGIDSDIRVISAQQSASLLENAWPRAARSRRQDSVQILMH